LRQAGGVAVIKDAYSRIVGAAAWLGALRLYAREAGVALNFDGLRFSTFIDSRTLEVDPAEMVRKVFARSLFRGEVPKVVARLTEMRASTEVYEIACGKDVLEVLSQALSRHYKCCSAQECSVDTLGRILRVSATLDDLRAMTLYERLATVVSTVPFRWAGVAL
jgi:hypothetical protein